MKSDFFLTESKIDLADWHYREILYQLGYMADIFHEMMAPNLQLQGFHNYTLVAVAQYTIG